MALVQRSTSDVRFQNRLSQQSARQIKNRFPQCTRTDTLTSICIKVIILLGIFILLPFYAIFTSYAPQI